MNIDPGILCFSHCSTSIFCIQVPNICPICGHTLSSNSITPFRIPYPFVRAKQTICAILLKPSTGTFLNCYSITSDLHVGISSSTGEVFEYDFKGLKNSNTEAWNQCLLIYQLKDPAWHQHWDSVLQSIYDQRKFSSETYHEDAHNCYSFVLTFVRELRHNDFTDAAECKTIFCQKFVIPRLKDAMKYVSLFRNVTKHDSDGFWHPGLSSSVHNSTDEGIIE